MKFSFGQSKHYPLLKYQLLFQDWKNTEEIKVDYNCPHACRNLHGP